MNENVQSALLDHSTVRSCSPQLFLAVTDIFAFLSSSKLTDNHQYLGFIALEELADFKSQSNWCCQVGLKVVETALHPLLLHIALQLPLCEHLLPLISLTSFQPFPIFLNNFCSLYFSILFLRYLSWAML